MRIFFFGQLVQAIRIGDPQRSQHHTGGMSIEQITRSLIKGNEQLFDTTPTAAPDAELATTDLRDRYVDIPREVGLAGSDDDYFDKLWNWVKGVAGYSTTSYIPYPLHTSKYLNEYVYRRTFDPSDSRDPNIAGDIIIDPAWRIQGSPRWNLWSSSNSIPYVIQTKDSCLRTIVNEAMLRVQEATSGCVGFTEVPAEGANVLVVSASGNECFSSLGKRNDMNVINLGTGCVNVGTVMHLLGHVLGMGHEDQRPDAREYVTINPSNIDVYGMSPSSNIDPTNTTKYGYVFEVINGSKTAWESVVTREPFEYGSLMHNSRGLYSVNVASDFTISGNKGSRFEDLIGQRGFLTERDARVLNEMYSCQRLPTKVVDRALSRPLTPGVTFDAINTCIVQDANHFTADMKKDSSSA